jgi:hypothetical protein
MQKWEYKLVWSLSEPKMNQLGEEGWELVAAVVPSSTDTIAFYFKRPKVATQI